MTRANAPIYTEFYVIAKESEQGAFRVHFPDPSGETDGFYGHLRLGSLEDVIAGQQIFVQIEHIIQYPYAKWDCEYIGRNLKAELGFEVEPRLYCKATIVATPQMALIA